MYIQHCYKKVVHTFIDKSHFENFFRCLSPSPLNFVYGSQGGVAQYIIEDALKVEKNVENIMQIHFQV
jgi:hypothetical protein